MKPTLILWVLALCISSALSAQISPELELELLQPTCNTTNVGIKEKKEFHSPVINYPPYIYRSDSDGDGIPDYIEMLEGVGLQDADGDGIPNYQDPDSPGFIDANNNGIDDRYDPDGDGIPNYLDLDSDGDTLLDSFETAADNDNDLIPNFLDLDSDGDGVLDQFDACYYDFGIPPSGCPSTSNDRKVLWLHGYRGNETTFDKVKADVEARFKVDDNTAALDYGSNQSSLEEAATETKEDIEHELDADVNTERNFIIAHSMGGVVARKMGMVNNQGGGKGYNGLITFGSPHQGIYAANTVVHHPQKVEDALLDACTSLSMGPGNEFASQQGFWGELLVAFGAIGKGVNFGCNVVSNVNETVGNPFPLFGLLKTGIEPELTTDAIAGLAPMPTDHNVVFYGVEDGVRNGQVVDGSLTPRFIGALLRSHNTFELYQADASDQIGMAKVQDLQNFYVTKWNYYKGMHVNTTAAWLLAIFNPLAIVTAIEAETMEANFRELENGYRVGTYWFGRLDPTWRALIGVTTTEIVGSGCECETEDNQGSAMGTTIYPNATDCENLGGSYTICYPLYNVVTTHKESDAWTLVESAANGPGMNYEAKLMDGSNHMQMKNDSRMEAAIKLIFEQGMGLGADNYFYTEPK